VRFVSQDAQNPSRRWPAAARAAVLAACLGGLPCAGTASVSPPATVTEPAAMEPVSTPAIGRSPVPAPAVSLFAGAGAVESALGTVDAPAGTLSELAHAHPGRYGPVTPRPDSTTRASRSHPVRVASRSDRPGLSAAADPHSAPGGGAALACGLAVLVFMARRKLSAPTA
jgi:hypothetical protein